MKTLSISLVLLAVAFAAASQSSLPPGMTYVPHTLLNYDYWRDTDKNISVRGHYAARYLEANHQYQGYLRCLKAWGQDSLWQLAQPDPSVWEVPGLIPTEQAYLKENYWTAKEFEHYPVVGLGFEQVKRYLVWKTDMLNLAAYEINGGDQDYVTGTKAVAIPAGFPKQFSTKEYIYQTNDSTRLFSTYGWIRLPTAQELFSELPLRKRTKSRKAASDKRLLAWLETQPKFGFLLYEPPKSSGSPTAIQLTLEAMGIRPVVASDLDKLDKRKDATNLPLLCMEQHLSKQLYKGGYVHACSEEELKVKLEDPDFNPKNLPVVVFGPEKVGTVAWVSNKGKLVSLSIANVDERPLCGFRAMMTKGD